MRSFAADGNFKADHIKQKNDHDDVHLTDGEVFMTNSERYKLHLATAEESKQVRYFLYYQFGQIGLRGRSHHHPVQDSGPVSLYRTHS